MIRIYLTKWRIEGDETKNDIIDILNSTLSLPGITASFHYPSMFPNTPIRSCLVIIQAQKNTDLSVFNGLKNTQLLPISNFHKDYSKFSAKKLKKFNRVLANAGYKRKVKNTDTEGKVMERLMRWLEPLSKPLRKGIIEDMD